MKIVASMVVAEVERDRYLQPCVASLLEFCDEVVLLFDLDHNWSKELVGAWGEDGDRVIGIAAQEVDFIAHEGRTRQRLLEMTLEREPTHVLSIDADEFVSDGKALRELVEWNPQVPAWSLVMEEIWELDGHCLCVREDGGWRAHPVPVLWKAPDARTRASEPGLWRIEDRQLACGREPVAVVRNGRLATASGSEILHFGWANQSERAARHQRYVEADGGKFHASAHLDSIMWPEDRVTLRGREWPEALLPYRADISYRALTPA